MELDGEKNCGPRNRQTRVDKVVNGKCFRLADEIRYIQGKPADHDGLMLTIDQLILFSTDTGAAWLLDIPRWSIGGPSGQGLRPERTHLDATDTSCALAWHL